MVFELILDTQMFSKVMLFEGFKIILFVTYFGLDVRFEPKQPCLSLNLWE